MSRACSWPNAGSWPPSGTALFFSLRELADAIEPLVERLNNRRMRKLGKSRREVFEELERGALMPLPKDIYVYADWAYPKVSLDYHVEFDDHFYSVPYTLIGQRLDLRATAMTIEILQLGHRITSHQRSYVKNGHTTKEEHMPSHHRAYAKWTPERLSHWARTVGPKTSAMAEEIMRRRRHPEQGFRACLGLIRLSERYDAERVEKACARALKHGAISYQSIVSILAHKLDQVDDEPAQSALPLHTNIRGPGYYN